MTVKWPIMSLKEANVSLIDCVHNTPPAADSGYPYVAIPQMKSGRIDISDARRISKEHFEEWTKKAMPIFNDVILSRRCNPGETAFVDQELQCALGQNLVLLRTDGTKVYPPFLRWLVRSPEWWGQVEKFINAGAVFDSLKCKDIPNFQLTIPPVENQIEIADFLGALDDKIELNRQINQTLEQIAQAIFKSWFVDFEPVKAKIEAKAAGRDPERAAMCAISGKIEPELDQLPPEQYQQLAATAALFPDELVESELGLIPQGWKASQIGNEIVATGGGTPSTQVAEFWENGTYNWATPKDFSNLSDKILLSTERKITEEGLTKISSGLLPAGTVLMSSRAPVGYLAITKIPTAVNQGFIAMKCNKDLSPEFCLQWAHYMMDDIKQRASGTTFAEISKSNFRQIPVVVPSKWVIDSYTITVSGIYELIASNAAESTTFSEIRDSLLPKLLSGELSIEGDMNG